jgi:hypothetical protein
VPKTIRRKSSDQPVNEPAVTLAIECLSPSPKDLPLQVVAALKMLESFVVSALAVAKCSQSKVQIACLVRLQAFFG